MRADLLVISLALILIGLSNFIQQGQIERLEKAVMELQEQDNGDE